MLTLLLVDDEPTIRKGLLTCIDWRANGIAVTGEACNGAEALEKALQLCPDIILTDIRMPVMDGIELVCQVRNQLPECKIVIMSGYDEFDYAKRLMGMRVTDYLLKPVDEEELLGSLHRLSGEILQEKKQRANLETAVWLRYENASQLRAQLMQRLIQGGFRTMEEMSEWGKALNIALDLQNCRLTMLALAIDPFAKSQSNLGKEEEKLLHYAITNIADEMINEKNSGFLCYGDPFPHFVGLVGQKAGGSEEIASLSACIKSTLQKYLNQRTFIAWSSPVPDMENIAAAYEQALSALHDALHRGKRSFIKVALGYMEDHFGQDISLTDVAKEACVTPNYLSRVFKEEMNTRFVDWLNQLRIQKAMELLRSSTLKTYEIAEKVGYKNYKYFTAVFKKHTGFAPKEYRDR